MVISCSYCRELHYFPYCHKGLQLIKYMKNRNYLETCTTFELRWLMNYFTYKPYKCRKKMINKLLELDICNRLQECPICFEEFNIDEMVITSCHHAFCDHCILRHIQENDNCPICRDTCELILILSVITKERAKKLYCIKNSEDHQIEPIVIPANDIYINNQIRDSLLWFKFFITALMISGISFLLQFINTNNTLLYINEFRNETFIR